MNLSGYQFLQLLYESKHSILYKAVRLNDNQPVIIKLLPTARLCATDIKKFQQEYAIGSKLNSPYVVKYLGLYSDSQHQAIIFEDQNAISLEQALPKEGYSVEPFLTIAIQMAQGLSDIHQYDITHKDIKLSNFIITVDNKHIKYIDFGNASLLREENQAALNPNKVIGTLAYISPEQTGRMNRTVDYRTDFYSLGITLYKLLCGRLPFDVKEAMALIHWHLAKEPMPVQELKPGIPDIISKIIQKLLAKNPEERYQSAQGLLYDLKRCLSELTEKQQITPFEIAQQDIPKHFQISQRLYGREREIAQLTNALQRISIGAPEVLTVSGYSGIGKSALINEVQKPITLYNGRFLVGKYDQLSKTIAYSAIIQAFQGLIKQLLGEKDSRIQQWRAELLSAVGTNGQLINDMIPEAEYLLGKQPSVTNVDPMQAKNRFNRTFQKFITVFTKKEQPLVLFLDDLQWADTASLELIKLITMNPDTHYFLLIGAYRDNEVNESHPAIIALEEIKKAQVNVCPITLTSLDCATVQQWLADSMQDKTEGVKPLAELVYQKTQGNPFFVKMFMRALDNEKLLTRANNYQWQWNVEKIRQQQATDNVVEFMVQQIHKLEESAQNLLALASCLGHRFTIKLLAITSQQEPKVITHELQSIFNMSMAYQKGEAIHFAHDRVQEAAYSLLSEDQKITTHLSIGRLLLGHYSLEAQPDKVFDIVDHLNIGFSLIADNNERFKLAELNQLASHKAKNATAYGAALKYIKMALACFDKTSIWLQHAELAFSLYKEQAELEYLNADFIAAEAISDTVLRNTHSLIQKTEIYNLLMRIKILTTKNQEAISIGKTALALFDIQLPEKDFIEFKASETTKIKQHLAGKAISSLIDLPEITSLEQKAVLDILMTLFVPTAVDEYNLFTAVAHMAVNLILAQGQTPDAAISYAFYAILLCEDIETAREGYEFGLLAIELAEQHADASLKCKVFHTISILVNPWFKPFAACYALSNDSYHAGIESGEIQFAGYSRYHAAINLFCRGELLPDTYPEIIKLLEFCQRTKNQFAVDTILCIQNVIQTLLGSHDLTLQPDFILDIEQRKNYYALAYNSILMVQILYLFNKPNEALEYSYKAKKLLTYIPAQFIIVEHNFYQSLSLTALYHTVPKQEQAQYLSQVLENQQVMSGWSKHCPENFLHKHWLVEAELARIKGKSRAYECYEQAIRLAQQNGFLQDEALANELAGKFWLLKKREPIAKPYFTQAFLCYQRWGARSKTELLKKHYSHLLDLNSYDNAKSTGFSSFTTTNTNSVLLDMENVIKASQMISSDINFEKLLFNMMKIIIETAGAQNGALFLNDNSLLLAEAEYTLTGQIKVLQKQPLSAWNGAKSIIEFVKNTGQTVVLGNASEDKQFGQDPYILRHKTKSVLCIAIKKQEVLKGLLYVENNLANYAFTQHRISVLTILTSQMAISLENAGLFETIKKEMAERISTYASLQTSEKRYRILAQATHAVIWTADGKINFIEPQPSWAAFTGQHWKEYQGQGWLNAIHPDDRALTQEKWTHAIKTKSVHHNSKRLWYHQGFYKYVEVHAAPLINEQGEITEWIGTCLDVHELKQTEAALKSNSEQLQLALDAGKAGLWSWDVSTSSFIYDDRFKALFGIAGTRLLSTMEAMVSYIHPEDKSRFLDELYAVLNENNEDKYESEYRVIWADGSIHSIASRGQLFRNPAGQPQRLVGISLDITTRKQLENERIAALQLAEEQERRRAEEAEAYRQKLEEFIDTICHELRNPLNGIYGGTELLRDEMLMIKTFSQQAVGPLDNLIAGKLYHALNSASEQLNIISSCAEQQKVIVDDVLDLSKLESGKIELSPLSFNLKEAVNNVIQMFKPQITAKNLKVDMDLSKADNWLKADSHRLSQILINLLSNAVKFTTQGSIQIIGVTKHLSEQLIQLSLAIKDTGIGMSADEQSHLFERFGQANKTTSHQYGGSGLGLLISKKLIEKMGGAIEVKSQKWQGTQFSFTIQCQLATPEEQIEYSHKSQKRRLSTSASSTALNNLNILIVEDNVMNQRILTKYLEQLNCFCHTANDGIQALGKHEQFQFDLIFMDIEMPNMGGLEATRRIREIEATREHKTPIIGLSGNARAEQKGKALNTGMDDYLTKPYHKESIYELIRKYVRQQPLPKLARVEAQVEPSTIESSLPHRFIGNLATASPHLSPIKESIAQFKSSAASFLEQHYPLQLIQEQQNFTFTLPIGELIPTRHICASLLKDLRKHLKTALDKSTIKYIQVIDNQLMISTYNLLQAKAISEFFMQVGLVEASKNISLAL